MLVKKIALRALALGMIVVAVMATHQPIPWDDPCTDAAIIANWGKVRDRLGKLLPTSVGKLGKTKLKQVRELLGGSYYLPIKPDLELEKKLFAIVGRDYMQYAIDEILN
ncbi:hypothetical protein GGI00_006564, partial [Coemansia sp. RSA 2681]